MTTLAPSRDDVDTAAVERMLATTEDLPTIPETLIEILNVIDDPDSGPADLAAAVRRDAPLMTKILKLANSPYYSPRADIADINRCVAVLGYRTVRQVAICVQVATVMVKAVAEAGGRLDYAELWRHSVVTGAVAKSLAVLTGHPEPEEIFTAGLIHDIGKFVLELREPERYAEIVHARHEAGLTLSEMEMQTFGCDHARLGEAFAAAWRFPAHLAAGCGQHHERFDPGTPEATTVSLVALADYLANTIAAPRSDLGFDPLDADPGALHRDAGLELAALEAELPRLHTEIARAAPYLSIA